MNSIEKSLAVMRALSAPYGPHRLADLAVRSGLNRPSVHRILQILVEGNYARAAGDGFYASGLAMRALASGDAGGDVVSAAEAILRELQKSTGHTVHFAVRAGDAAVYLAKVEGDKPYQMASRVGMQIMLHCTSIGKAILSALPPSEVTGVLERTVEMQEASGKVPDPERLRQELDEIALRGYSIDDEENEPNVRCVGAAVRDATGAVIGGISISGLAMIIDLEKLAELGPLVVATAAEISRQYGDVDVNWVPA
jgi:IclR family acetate operon transcriptional repressor